MKMADALFSSSWRILEPYGCSGILRHEDSYAGTVRSVRLGTLMPAWSEDLRRTRVSRRSRGRLESRCLNSGTASSETNF